MLLSILQASEDVERTSISTKGENTTNPTPFDITSTNMCFTRSNMEGASMATRPQGPYNEPNMTQLHKASFDQTSSQPSFSYRGEKHLWGTRPRAPSNTHNL